MKKKNSFLPTFIIVVGSHLLVICVSSNGKKGKANARTSQHPQVPYHWRNLFPPWQFNRFGREKERGRELISLDS